jgi:carbon storage regulator
MLIMQRSAGETILIGSDIEIHIAQIGRRRVKIGINAPRHVPVVAKEVKDVGDENRRAALDPFQDVAALLTAARILKSRHSSPMSKLSAAKRPDEKTEGRSTR